MSEDQINALREREPFCWIPTATARWLEEYDGPACATQTAVHNRPIKSDGGVPLYADPPPLTDLEAENARLKARLAEALEALHLFEQYGCPVCHGDCASANPPVNSCPMQAARRVREGGRVDD